MYFGRGCGDHDDEDEIHRHYTTVPQAASSGSFINIATVILLTSSVATRDSNRTSGARRARD